MGLRFRFQVIAECEIRYSSFAFCEVFGTDQISYAKKGNWVVNNVAPELLNKVSGRFRYRIITFQGFIQSKEDRNNVEEYKSKGHKKG